MVQSGGELDLAEKPFGAERGGQLRAQNFDRDRAVVFQVPGEINRGHPARPEFALDRVTIRKRVLQALEQLGHGSHRRRLRG